VEQLHLGRVSLIARTLNANQFWYWDQTQRHWLSLTTIPSTDINRAFDIAAQKVAPAMLTRFTRFVEPPIICSNTTSAKSNARKPPTTGRKPTA